MTSPGILPNQLKALGKRSASGHMESSQSNKFIMAFLATVFVVMTIGISSDAIFSTSHPEKAGYEIAAAEGGAPAAGGKEAAVAVPIATLLASSPTFISTAINAISGIL